MHENSAFKIGVRVPAAGPIREVVATAQRAEAAGLDMAWFSDSPLNYRELWSTLGAVAVSTDRIQIGPAVTNLVSRHPTVTAAAARSISETAPGRFMIGIGSGDSAVGFDGMRPSKVAEMERGVQKLRALMRGETVDHEGFGAHLRDADQTPPILVSASGPRTLAMAGRVADGVIALFGNIDEKMPIIARGATEAGRPSPPVYCGMVCGIIDDVEKALMPMKVGVARMAQFEGVEQFERAGFKVQGEFLSHTAGARGDIGHAASVFELAKEFDRLISDDLALWFMQTRTLLGTEAEIEERLARLPQLGLAGVYLTMPENSVLPNALIDTLAPILTDARSAR